MCRLIAIFLISSIWGFSCGVLASMPGELIKHCTQTSVINNDKIFNIEITVTQTSSYCAGMRPSPEILTALQSPGPMAQKKLYIKKGDKNMFSSKIFLELCTDSSGKVQFQLPPGKYFVVDDLKKDTSYYNTLIRKYSKPSKNYSAIEKGCLKNWYEQPEMVFEITNSDQKKLTLNFHNPCDWKKIPCLEYMGPLPQ